MEGGVGKVSDATRLLAAFRATRVLGVRRRHAPQIFKKNASGNVNLGFRVVFNLGVFLAPHYLLMWGLKTFQMIGGLVAIVGGFGQVKGGFAGVMAKIYGTLSLLNLDIKFGKPGCGGTSGKFVPLYWANLDLMWDYAFFPLVGLPLLAGIGWLGEHAGRGLQYRRFHFRMHKMRKNYYERLFAAMNFTLEFMYLQLIKLSLFGVACEKIELAGESSYRLRMELSEECFTPEHMPVFVASIFILSARLFLARVHF